MTRQPTETENQLIDQLSRDPLYITLDQLSARQEYELHCTHYPPINASPVERYFCRTAQQAARNQEPEPCPYTTQANGTCPLAPGQTCILGDKTALQRLARLLLP